MPASVFERLEAKLQEAGVAFSVSRHRPVFTSEEAAAVRGAPLASGAKALVVKAGDAFVLLIIPADRKLDSKKARGHLGVCEQLKSWWYFCTQNGDSAFAWQFTGVSRGVQHVDAAATHPGTRSRAQELLTALFGLADRGGPGPRLGTVCQLVSKEDHEIFGADGVPGSRHRPPHRSANGGDAPAQATATKAPASSARAEQTAKFHGYRA